MNVQERYTNTLYVVETLLMKCFARDFLGFLVLFTNKRQNSAFLKDLLSWTKR